MSYYKSILSVCDSTAEPISLLMPINIPLTQKQNILGGLGYGV